MNDPIVARILVVDDDSDLLGLVSRQLLAAGYQVETCEHPLEAEQLITRGEFDLLLTDLEMPGLSGIDLLRLVKETDPSLVVILLTGYASIDTAVEAMKLGAFDYLRKPFPPQELLVVIEKGLSQRSLLQENRLLRSELREKYHFRNVIGNSPAIHEVFRLVEKVGPTSSTVLILGESGTGKELIARALHEISPRNHRRYLKINCSALAESLLESELFGHERGAFTGAVTTRQGLFEAAHGGTLFLDEVGDTPPSLQAKLLRVLQESEIRRVGGIEDIKVNVRLIAATNRNLKDLTRQGFFREDLFFRLNVFSLSLPPLRERRDDIPLLVHHFLDKKKEADAPRVQAAPEVMESLYNYDWPGNIRELENAVERALVLCENSWIKLADLPDDIRSQSRRHHLMAPSILLPPQSETDPPDRESVLPQTLAELEKEHIRQVLESVGGQRARAAALLGITRRTLYDKIKRWNLEDPAS